jgi:hypothetical protein
VRIRLFYHGDFFVVMNLIKLATASMLLFPSAVQAAPEISTSVQDSKKLGIFLRSVSVRPDKFTWNGHQVSVRECWLERSKKTDHNQLLISFTIDGKEWKEHYIAHKEKRYLKLKCPDDEKLGYISYFNYLPPSRFWKTLWIFGGGYGNYIHFMDFQNRPPKILNLKVGTKTLHDKSIDPNPNLFEMSDVSLSIDVGDVDAKGE